MYCKTNLFVLWYYRNLPRNFSTPAFSGEDYFYDVSYRSSWEWEEACICQSGLVSTRSALDQTADPLEYISLLDSETREDKSIRIYQYLRLHQEADEEVNPYLIHNAGVIQASFTGSHPFLLGMDCSPDWRLLYYAIPSPPDIEMSDAGDTNIL